MGGGGGVHLRFWGYGSSWNVPIHAWHWMTTQWRWQSFDIFRSNTSSSSSSASSSSITKSPGDNWAVLQQFALIRAQIWNKGKANFKKQRFWKNTCSQLVQRKLKLIASIKFWKIHVCIIQFGKKGKSNMKENGFSKLNIHSLIKKTEAHSFNPILENPFWDNPISHRGKSHLKENASNNNKCSQLDPQISS